jgi:hypothetical protein
MFVLCLCQRLCLKVVLVVADSTLPPKVLVVVQEDPIISFGSDSFQCICALDIWQYARKHIPLWANIRYIVYDEVRNFSISHVEATKGWQCHGGRKAESSRELLCWHHCWKSSGKQQILAKIIIIIMRSLFIIIFLCVLFVSLFSLFSSFSSSSFCLLRSCCSLLFFCYFVILLLLLLLLLLLPILLYVFIIVFMFNVLLRCFLLLA